MAADKNGNRQGAKAGDPKSGSKSAAKRPPPDPDDRGKAGGRRNGWLMAAIVAVPVVVFAVFLTVGPLRSTLTRPDNAPGAAAGGSASAGATAPAQPGADRAHLGDAEIQQMAERLAARLEREPGDAAGWRTLARTYYVLKRFGDAVTAYDRLSKLAPIEDADVLADYADALAMSQGQRLEGRPMELVGKALEKNPSQWKALSMAATYAFQRNDFRTAASHWERALASLPPDSDMASAIRSSLEQARRSADAAPAAGPQGQAGR